MEYLENRMNVQLKKILKVAAIHQARFGRFLSFGECDPWLKVLLIPMQDGVGRLGNVPLVLLQDV